MGGGAAGLAAAVAASDRARELGVPLDVTVYERDDRVGRSILATGNGRCNFSNEHIQLSEYRNEAFVAQAYSALEERFGNRCVMDFFENLGLEWRQEDDGRRYPLANKASVVLDVLRAAAGQAGVCEAVGVDVRQVRQPRGAGKPFTLHRADSALERADAVIVACGGRALDSLSVEGPQRLPLAPVLGPLRVSPADIPLVRELDNIRIRCTVALSRLDGGAYRHVKSETGELMFRKYGVSGICVFNLSRFAQPGDTLQVNVLGNALPRDARQINVLGNAQPGSAAEHLLARRRILAERYGEGLTYAVLLRGLLLPRVSEALLKHAGIDVDSAVAESDVPDLAQLLMQYPLEVAGMGDQDICQVRRGGFTVEDVDAETMQVRGVPGLFLAGEALDVDGPCGGYNLHWAWSSGILAACNAVELVGGTL